MLEQIKVSEDFIHTGCQELRANVAAIIDAQKRKEQEVLDHATSNIKMFLCGCAFVVFALVAYFQ